MDMLCVCVGEENGLRLEILCSTDNIDERGIPYFILFLNSFIAHLFTHSFQ